MEKQLSGNLLVLQFSSNTNGTTCNMPGQAWSAVLSHSSALFIMILLIHDVGIVTRARSMDKWLFNNARNQNYRDLFDEVSMALYSC